tara:strand:- start:25 stop:264 length:240 start_codon:yes stop_codon:yes gene_type:complete
MIWIVVIIIIMMIAAMAASMFMGSQQPPPVQDQTLEVPTTNIGTPIGVLFGTRLIQQPNVVWYGHINIVKVKISVAGKK